MAPPFKHTPAQRPTPHCVYGGYRMAYEDWSRSDEGWDCDHDYDGLPSDLFPTFEACEAAIADLLAGERGIAA